MAATLFNHIVQTLKRSITVAPFSLPLCDRLSRGRLLLELQIAPLGLANCKAAHLLANCQFDQRTLVAAAPHLI